MQQILSTAIRELSWDLIEQYAIDDYAVVQKAKAEGVQFYKWDSTELDKLRKVAIEVLDEWAAKSAKAQAIATSQKEWLRTLGLISQ